MPGRYLFYPSPLPLILSKLPEQPGYDRIENMKWLEKEKILQQRLFAEEK